MNASAPSPTPAIATPLAKPAGRHGAAWAVFLLTTVFILAADLGFKAWSFAHVANEPVVLTREVSTSTQQAIFWQAHAHEPLVVLPGVLSLHLTSNTGAVFGAGKGWQWLFAIVSIAAVGIILRVFWVSGARAWVYHLALGLILAGALGNLYDRMVFNAVRDMLWLFPDLGLWPWIFNIADAALMVGVGLLLLTLWRQPRPSPAP